MLVGWARIRYDLFTSLPDRKRRYGGTKCIHLRVISQLENLTEHFSIVAIASFFLPNDEKYMMVVILSLPLSTMVAESF